MLVKKCNPIIYGDKSILTSGPKTWDDLWKYVYDIYQTMVWNKP